MSDIIGKPKCGTCKHCEGVTSPGGNELVCFRLPPQILIAPGAKGQTVILSKWPNVQAHQHCGEWSPRMMLN